MYTELTYHFQAESESGGLTLPDGFTVTNDTDTGIVGILVSADDMQFLPLGLHIIDVREVDSITGYSKTTQYLIFVEEVDFEPFEGVVIEDVDHN